MKSTKMLSFLTSVEYNISGKDKIKYANEFMYIEKYNKEVKELKENTQVATDLCKKYHSLFLALHKKVDTANSQYTKLNESIARLKRLMGQTDKMKEETMKTIDKFKQIESIYQEIQKEESKQKEENIQKGDNDNQKEENIQKEDNDNQKEENKQKEDNNDNQN